MTRILDVAGGKSTEQQKAAVEHCWGKLKQVPMWHIRLFSAVFVRVLLSHPQCEYDASAPVPFGVLQ